MRIAAPAGFELGRVLGPSQTSNVFEVARDGVVFVCKRPSARTITEGRVEREGRALAALAGRGAPKLVLAGSDESGPFLVMEAIGASACTPERAFAALAAVHEAGDDASPLEMVHGDVSPSNVLGNATLIDFGLASWRDARRPPGTFAGTLRYAAPEVARGESLGQPADVFAMAATLLHLATGLPPREAASPAAMLALAGEATMDDYLERCAPLVAPQLLEALARCLAFDPRARPSAGGVRVSWD